MQICALLYFSWHTVTQESTKNNSFRRQRMFCFESFNRANSSLPELPSIANLCVSTMLVSLMGTYTLHLSSHGLYKSAAKCVHTKCIHTSKEAILTCATFKLFPFPLSPVVVSKTSCQKHVSQRLSCFELLIKSHFGSGTLFFSPALQPLCSDRLFYYDLPPLFGYLPDASSCKLVCRVAAAESVSRTQCALVLCDGRGR